MEPLIVDSLSIIAQLSCPSGGQLLWHDMLNGVLTAVQSIIDLLIFRAIPIFKTLEDIGFVPGGHGIDILRFQTFRKILICWESSFLFLEMSPP